ncbi:MAG: CpaF family protein [Kineosporiaceae bacterium]|nr:CpaF family protein [Aeromicrobium sp.]
MSQVDIDAVRALHQSVGDRVQREQNRRRSAGEAVLGGGGERQYVRAAITEVLRQHAEDQLDVGQPTLTESAEDEISEIIFARMFGAGRLQHLLDDDAIENIDINGSDEVWISRAGQDFADRSEPIAGSDAELIELVQTLGSYSGLSSRPFDAANPELDLQLPDGSRLSALMAVAARPSVSIRRHRLQKVTLADLVGLNTMSEDVAEFLRAVTRARFNLIIAGGTNGGKTTLLRAIAAEIDPRERLITIEKAFELGLREDIERHPNTVALESRPSNSEGVGEITMAQLVRRTLRQNPDRVIVGEVLGDEIVPMLNAMSQGNDGSLSTIHADSARETFARISSYAQQAHGLPRQVVHEMVAGAIDYVVFISRDRHGGHRRIRTVLEVNGYDEHVGVSASELFTANAAGEATRNVDVAVQRAADLVAAGWDDAGGGWT